MYPLATLSNWESPLLERFPRKQVLRAMVVLFVLYTLKKIYSARYKTIPLSEEQFWNRIETVSVLTNHNEPIVMGDQTFANLREMHTNVFLQCGKPSKFVKQYLIRSTFQGRVLDLGSGIGSNAIPLLKKGCSVTVIEMNEQVMEKYKQLLRDQTRSRKIEEQSILGDITDVAYPENMDAVMCVDVLSYLPPDKLKATLLKIFRSLRPRGQFIGTIFFKREGEQNFFTQRLETIGIKLFPKALVLEIFTRCGFRIKKSMERIYPERPRSYSLEFLAEKP